METTEFTAQGIQKLAVLINCFTAIGSALLSQRTGNLKQGFSNLQKFKNENKILLEEVHSLALRCNAVSALRLSEDLERPGADAFQLLDLVHRCLAASVFLSHCIATSEKQKSFTVSEQPTEPRHLH